MELEYALGELGLHGVEICSNVAGANLDVPRFRAFFDTVQCLDVPVFVHPTNVAASDRLQRYYLGNLIGNPLDTGICMASLIFGGVLAATFPELTMIFAHGDGIASFVVGRWNHGRSVRPECQELLRPPVAYLQQLYDDTLCHDTRALQYLRDTVGASQIVLGTDYPFDMGGTQPLQTIAAVDGLSDVERATMQGGTAARLYGITV